MAGTPSMNPVGALDDLNFQNISGKPHPKADSIIDRSHRNSTDRGLFCVGTKVELLARPDPTTDNTAIIHAVVMYRDIDDPAGETFTWEDIGDACPGNCSSGVGMHFIRVAVTRAIARAHGQALNIAEAVAEEIAEGGTGGNAVAAANTAGRTAGTTPAVAGGGLAALKAQFPGQQAFKFTYPGKKGEGNAGKPIDSPDITAEDLQYWLDRWDTEGGCMEKNPATNQYDKLDTVRPQIFLAEIARRSATPATAPVPAGTVPDYGASATAAPAGAFKATTYQRALLAAVTASGKKWPDAVKYAKSTFEKTIADLDRDEFEMLWCEYSTDAPPA